MADNTGCIRYLLSSGDTWEAQEKLSLISYYSSTLLRGRNKIKIEPIFESGCEKQIEKKHYKCGDASTQLLKSSHQLIEHKTKQTDEKPYKCNICDKQFSICSRLKKHAKIHTDVKPYTCNSCDKTFSRGSDLKKHTRVHSGEKPYTCDICDKKFSQSSNLKRHTRIHTRE